MRGVLLVTAVLAATTPAAGQETAAVKACKQAAVYYTAMADVPIAAAHDFSELDPPRARLDLGGSGLTMHCMFRSPEPPTGITGICFPDRDHCIEAGNPEFDEVQALLEREGL